MIQIQPAQVTPQLARLLASVAPAGLRRDAVLEGVDAGVILTDDPANPAWGAVWETGDGTLYLGGSLDAETVAAIVVRLQRGGDVLFGFWDGDPLARLLPPHPDYDGRVLEFLDRPAGGAGLAALAVDLPDGYGVRPADAELLSRGLWGEDTMRRHGSLEAFLAKGRALFLVHGDTVIAEAYAGPCIGGTRELGAVTAEPYRERGYATLLCAHLVRDCEVAGERTYWNCAVTNAASAAVARKLGYRIERAYRLLAWYRQ
jgi:hypothetical protein